MAGKVAAVSFTAQSEIDQILDQSRQVRARIGELRRDPRGAIASFDFEKRVRKRRTAARHKIKVLAQKADRGVLSFEESLILPQLMKSSTSMPKMRAKKMDSLQFTNSIVASSFVSSASSTSMAAHSQPNEKEKMMARKEIFEFMDADHETEETLEMQLEDATYQPEIERLQRELYRTRAESSARLHTLLNTYNPKPVKRSDVAIARAQAAEKSLCTLESSMRSAGSRQIPNKKRAGKPKKTNKKTLAPKKGKFDVRITADGEEYLFDRSDGYDAYPTSPHQLQKAVDDSTIPIAEMPFNRPTTETGFGVDRGLAGIVGDHVTPIDTSFPSLQIYERESQKDQNYWMKEAQAQPLPAQKTSNVG